MELTQIYKCEICGNIVEVVHVGGGQLICCNQPMDLLEENSTDAAQEKHVPVIEKSGSKVTVKIGNVTHPMEEKHYIEFVEVLANGKVYRKFLNPGDAPEATFEVEAEKVNARGYCNLHGLWKA